MMNDNLKYWLAFNQIEQLGPITIKKLFGHFGSIKAAWLAGPGELKKVEGLRPSALQALLEGRTKISPEAEAARLGPVQAICLEDESYPGLLKEIYAPPPVIYLNGAILKSDEKAVAIVGTRRASRYGLGLAGKLARELSGLGFTIVSGMAIGIDSAAHQGALAAGGRTIAVLGSAVDEIYPASNRGLAKEIEACGAVVSEFPLGRKPEKGFFPRRNRIIAGLSLGIVMIEGGEDSGAMITAGYALDEGREVFAVPGNLGSAGVGGPHKLIKQGAKLIESVDDIIEELKYQITNNESQKNPKYQIPELKLNEEEKKIMSAIALEPKHLDAIAAETGLSIPQVSSTLALLEIKQLIRQRPGKIFQLY